MAITFDKMAYYGRLKEAGVPEPTARAMTDGLDQALKEEVATKTDLMALKSDLEVVRLSLTNDINGVRTELRIYAGVLGAGLTVVLGKMLIFAS